MCLQQRKETLYMCKEKIEKVADKDKESTDLPYHCHTHTSKDKDFEEPTSENPINPIEFGKSVLSVCFGDKCIIVIFTVHLLLGKVTHHLRELAFASETALSGLACPRCLINNSWDWNYPGEHMVPAGAAALSHIYHDQNRVSEHANGVYLLKCPHFPSPSSSLVPAVLKFWQPPLWFSTRLLPI